MNRRSARASGSARPVRAARRSGEAHPYRLNHPLAEVVVAQAKRRELPSAEIRFAYSDHQGKITLPEPLVGKSGWLSLSLFTVESLDQAEDHLIFAAVLGSLDIGLKRRPVDSECGRS